MNEANNVPLVLCVIKSLLIIPPVLNFYDNKKTKNCGTSEETFSNFFGKIHKIFPFLGYTFIFEDISNSYGWLVF